MRHWVSLDSLHGCKFQFIVPIVSYRRDRPPGRSETNFDLDGQNLLMLQEKRAENLLVEIRFSEGPSRTPVPTKTISSPFKPQFNSYFFAKIKDKEVEKGAYIALDTMKKPMGIIMSSGEELHQVLEVAKRLKNEKDIRFQIIGEGNVKEKRNPIKPYR